MSLSVCVCVCLHVRVPVCVCNRESETLLSYKYHCTFDSRKQLSEHLTHTPDLQ